jgi:hypothetical protein
VSGDISVYLDGREQRFSPGQVARIGRATDADVRTHNAYVSRQHALVRHDGSGWVLEDAGSSQGTFLMGVRVTSLPVTGAIELHLGDPLEGPALRLWPQGAPPPPPPGQAPMAVPQPLLGRPAQGAHALGSSFAPEQTGAATRAARVRTIVASGIVLGLALATRFLLRSAYPNAEGVLDDLLSVVGFSWLPLVSRVDNLLPGGGHGARRVSSGPLRHQLQAALLVLIPLQLVGFVHILGIIAIAPLVVYGVGYYLGRKRATDVRGLAGAVACGVIVSWFVDGTLFFWNNLVPATIMYGVALLAHLVLVPWLGIRGMRKGFGAAPPATSGPGRR